MQDSTVGCENLLSISINKSDPAHRHMWESIWRCKEFENWADAKGWLWDEYKGTVRNSQQGFVIDFLYQDEAVRFVLSHLYA